MQIAFSTDVGRRRQSNQDYVQVYRNQAGVIFAAVADGMGGHRGGDVASDMVINHFGTVFEQTDLVDVHQIARWANDFLTTENERIIQTAQEKTELSGMGTTIVGVFIVDQQMLVFNVGDSRCYLLTATHLQQLSFDHSLVNELLVAGEITPQEAKDFPNKNVITQSLGVSSGVQPTFGFFDVPKNAQILLCSDGLTNMINDQQIKTILQKSITVKQKCSALVNAANQAGGLDNITALVIAINDDDEVQGND
ncbi:Stp1/IreP family PP2C-type Ser/Thr phosphatase [Bombilactobacillus thymidiniphilus]|uniref:Stp1/IreP family PP2C-type Ser/Thr phosphatase n=1 Tax=Bombilactobacillus thymidiniphilus TaxID=2923363 RepID=A0ABY4PCT9_9LACO|nr:Stp1/IreP family PP2C-type Ser/Thr phosphatase [Bombilactobacillus thymidiniphilus]UQS83459.1 Stp1/IreP family PP2C-type Ser/Thr phosphatase [Bombilactobacillus thymidiniphilus]